MMILTICTSWIILPRSSTWKIKKRAFPNKTQTYPVSPLALPGITITPCLFANHLTTSTSSEAPVGNFAPEINYSLSALYSICTKRWQCIHIISLFLNPFLHPFRAKLQWMQSKLLSNDWSTYWDIILCFERLCSKAHICVTEYE